MKTICIALSLLLANAIHARSEKKSKQNTKNMEVITIDQEKNKAVVRNLYEQAINKQNWSLLPGLISDEYAGPGGSKGVTAFQEPVAQLIKAFPDIQWKIGNLVGEGDQVMLSWEWQGTHTAPFQKYMPTGKRISNIGMAVFRLKNEKVVSSVVLTDRLGFLQQLEVLPTDLGLITNRQNNPGQIRFIDKFFVPKSAVEEFRERMKINRNFIKTLPGFVEDAGYESPDENGNLNVITIAVWENKEVLDKAKTAVQAEYQKEGFNPGEMMKRLDIKMERGIYFLPTTGN